MTELKWKEAIIKVLEDENEGLPYKDIAELIAERKYRTSLGATPQDTVSAVITTDINTNQEKSVFVRVNRGVFILRKFLDDPKQLLKDEEVPKSLETEITTKSKVNIKLINAFGIYWNRNLIYWKTIPDLLGIQQLGASEVNFKDQIGVYLLHDGRETIYVGQAIDQPLGQRLKNHTNDRLSGRWDRFSWFGIYPISEDGKLKIEMNFENLTIQNIGDILEAILIETIEPRQNRKQGNLFYGIEYLQKEAPEIKKKLKEQLIKELTDKL